jgi:peptidyl-dipeptidase Dcp
MNPFFEQYTTPFGTIPFSQINIDNYVPAVLQGIEDAKAEVNAIVNNAAPPTFEHVIEW